ncbi:hypothetical protein [Janibacter terrae]|uniref:hypothetical protein n=1 Tax=Janibacter terrae TaxID=103817 RepID=UPI000A6B5C37|nr:hypothetical protein [Janibacter terrae]
MAANYMADGTYWTGREGANGFLEVLRLEATSTDYVIHEVWGSYKKRGSAVAAAAQLAYQQGRADALAEMQAKVHQALAGIGLGPIAVEGPDAPAGASEE